LQGAKEDGARICSRPFLAALWQWLVKATAPAALRRASRGFKFPPRAKLLQSLPRISWPSRDALKLAAVTGTNGKTTTTSLIDSIIKASGAKDWTLWHHRLSHTAWRLSRAEHHA